MNVILAERGQDSLLELSAQIGRDPLLVQASSGNTSLKAEGVLWIKASGKWLASADREEIFVPVDLSECVRRFERRESGAFYDHNAGEARLCPSIETFMHAVLPHPVVIHVHSVSAIAWAVRADAPARLAERLQGLDWQFIRYMPSGLPLAQAIQDAVRQYPRTNVFVLANHGLVLGSEDCAGASSLLLEVEERLAICPRPVLETNLRLLERTRQNLASWRPPRDSSLHFLGTDSVATRVAKGGVLYPCQAIFLGDPMPFLSTDEVSVDSQTCNAHTFLVAEGAGVLLDNNITPGELAVLKGFVEVLRRIDTSAPIRYLTVEEVSNVSSVSGRQYKAFACSGN